MPKKDISEELIEQSGKAMLVQKHQGQAIGNQVSKIQSAINSLSEINMDNLDNLDLLIQQAEFLCEQNGIDTNNYESYIEEIVTLSEEEKSQIQVENLEMLSIVGNSDNISWQDYMTRIEKYAEANKIDFSKDPFDDLMTESERLELGQRIREDYTMKKANCDKYDYLIAGFCGVATGLIDAFFVGIPHEGKLGKWTDDKVDNIVEKFAQGVWKSDKNKGINNSKSAPEGIASAIGYLERRFKVNYDARYASDLKLGDIEFKMSPSNHHIKSLAHSPDLIGLFFSILDQFTGENSFVSDGKIIRVESVKNGFELKGKSFFAKLFSGFCNWIGHIMSDIAGSSGTRGHSENGKGAGVPIPFFEMFQFCNFGSFNVNGEKKSLAELSVKVFESGYDARHGVAMAIPVAINEIMIRFLWAIKSRFYHKRSWLESMPFGSKPELRRMLLIGHGSLCLADGIDAGLRSRGNILNFALHLNIVAWSRFSFAGLQEIRIIYNQNALDISAIDEDLELEWKLLYSHMK
ncbi:hypothetical protein [Candidatus Clostridium stratigraminis]|uniref:Uncharacterized protein n=1 Tax=Candidatus Clostridium stratigraminis TaxID=3381661 RepID=A0ABW8TAJ8_9CLOT